MNVRQELPAVAGVASKMPSLRKPNLVLIYAGCLLLPLFINAPDLTTPAAAQDRTDRDDNDRRDSGDRARWSLRRDRSDRDDEEQRDEAGERADDEKLDDSPALSTEGWAKGFVKQYDKNKNTWLDGDELEAAGRRAQSADLDGDKVVTVNELVASATKGSKTAGATAPAAKPVEVTGKSSDASNDDSKGDSVSATNSKRVYTWLGGKQSNDPKSKRRTYRFTPAAERLPTGLPSWFKTQDKNGDGQVSMREYSRSWSRSTVATFRGYDLNDDGIVTAKEAAAK
jgi:hypothetical protein